MSIERKFEGKTVTDAAIEACKTLGITREELEFDVMEEGSSGIFGIGGRKALIKVKNEQLITNDVRTSEPLEDAPLDSERAPIDTEKTRDIFEQIVNHFVEEYKIDSELKDRNILLKMDSESNLGFLIGKNGEMIKNLEFLLSRIASKQNSQSVLVSVDINSYKEKKDNQLRDKVRSLVDKVISINRPLSLNPMNSYERRICYLIIEENSEVIYKTRDSGHLKKITIFPKKMDTTLS
ncbi:MAG: hypothetical protein CMN79_01820 [Spirochaetales bacterium]|nr:hypothetical protein [Spirochaetales bacterium]